MTNLFNNSETFFFKFINNYDIILDENYNNIKDLYYLDNTKINIIYKPYINIFNKYDYLKKDINFIYYIIILYYTKKNKLLNFIRFYTSKLNNYGLINITQIYNYNKLLEFDKKKLMLYLNKLINTNEEILFFFIICIQLYF
jgi:hypothetical protein|tara:strand:- start:78 stop:503 length:426 start_codon:yes stop_codon:yes gene_type:complete